MSTIIIMSKTIFLLGLKYIYCELKRVSELRESWGVYFNRVATSRNQRIFIIQPRPPEANNYMYQSTKAKSFRKPEMRKSDFKVLPMTS